MALSFTEGSIGGDIERIDLKALEEFYSKPPKMASAEPRWHDHEPRGSNGIAIAPTLTGTGSSLLLINPHTSFYFRSEAQVTSDEGLNVYGASTWGQFFVYQGFNERAGWMHTTSGVDNVDEFAEKIFPRGKGLLLSLRPDLPAADAARDHAALQGCGRIAEEPRLHRLDDPPRPDRPRRGRSLDRLCDDGPAGRGAAAKLSADQGSQPGRLYEGQRACARTARTPPSSPIRAARSLTSIRNSCRCAAPAFDYTKPVDGSDQSADWGRDPQDRRTAQHDPAQERLCLQHQQLAVDSWRRRQPQPRQISGLYGHAMAKIRAGSMRCNCSTSRDHGRSIDFRPRLTTARSRASSGSSRNCSALMTRCPRRTRAAPG